MIWSILGGFFGRLWGSLADLVVRWWQIAQAKTLGRTEAQLEQERKSAAEVEAARRARDAERLRAERDGVRTYEADPNAVSFERDLRELTGDSLSSRSPKSDT